MKDTVEKYKQVIALELKEKIVSRIQREEKEKNLLNKLLKKVTGKDSQVVKQVEEFHRIGKYEKENETHKNKVCNTVTSRRGN